MSGLAAVEAEEVDAVALAGAVEFGAVVVFARVEVVAIAPLAVEAIVAAGMVVELAARRRCRDHPVFLPR
jgi:hypothetical protein